MRLRSMTARILGLMIRVAVMAEDKKPEEIVINIEGKGGKSKYIRVGDTEPKDVKVIVGQTVKWVNLSSVPHTATSDKKIIVGGKEQFLFDTGELAKDQNKAITFDEQTYKDAGGKDGQPIEVPYHCKLHSQMKGKLILHPAGEAKKEGKEEKKPEDKK